MCGKKEEALLERRIEAAVPDNSYHFEQAKYELSLESWQQNFERTFRRHYERIPAYIAAVQGLKQEYEDKKIIVGCGMTECCSEKTMKIVGQIN